MYRDTHYSSDTMYRETHYSSDTMYRETHYSIQKKQTVDFANMIANGMVVIKCDYKRF